MIAAKNAASLRELNTLIKERKLIKKYICAVHGHMEKKSGILTGYMTKDKDKNVVSVYEKKIPGSKDIKTGYRVIAENDELSLLEVELFTGRTHQIRAHLASVGHPLLGDGKYGVNRDDRKIGCKFQALYSYYLKFGGGDLLSYLSGREFSVPAEKIWFVEKFFGGDDTGL